MQVQSLSGSGVNFDPIPASKEITQRKNNVGNQLIKKQESEKNQPLSFNSSSISPALGREQVKIQSGEEGKLSSRSDNERQSTPTYFKFPSASGIANYEQRENALYNDPDLSRPPDYEEMPKKKSFWKKCCSCFQKK
ncbi:MAG: hypothetical protein V4494_08130 [Chlamydiota bacterium]